MTAREDILSRIRAALGPEPAGPGVSHAQIEQKFHQHSELTREACLELLVDRLLDYDTEIIQIASEDEISGAITEVLMRESETRVVAPSALPNHWLPVLAGIEVQLDAAERPLSTAEIEFAQAVLTTCEVAIASTGTIILVHHGTQGRRILTLLPDHHICVVRRDQIVELVPEALALLSTNNHLPISTISGPSATSDIEMTRIRGVHGPRRLTVIHYG